MSIEDDLGVLRSTSLKRDVWFTGRRVL